MTAPIQLIFKRLDQTIDCNKFDCGEDALNRFLSVRSLTEMAQRLSVTTVALLYDGCIAGFYSISPTQIAKEFVGKREARGIPYDSVPAIRIGRLAVEMAFHGKGVGAMLLKHALQKCLKMSEEFGGRVVVVDAKNTAAAAFYNRYGFVAIRDNPLVLILKVSTIAKAYD